MKKKKRLKKEVIYFFIFLIPIPLLIFSSYKIFIYLDELNKTNKIIEQIEENSEVIEYEPEEEVIINSEEDKNTPYWNYIKMNLIDVDFTNLKSINEDTVAWVKVEGTNVNYPVVKTDNNDYYLDHDYNKNKNSAGWVFMDYRNDPSNYGKNTIIYAHNRKDKTMFGTLKNTLNDSWFNNTDNRVIKMSSSSNNTLWQIFSIYVIETTNDYIVTDFSTDNEFQEFIDLVKGRSVKDFNTTVTPNDKILTLSTCHGSTKKLVIHAKLIKIAEK